MTGDEIGQLFAKAEERFERASAVSARTDHAIARADTVIARSGSRDSAERAAARRERQRLNSGLGRTVKRVATLVVVLWIGTMIFGFFRPIGLFGLMAVIAVGLILTFLTASRRGRSRPAPPAPNLPAAELVERFDSYLYRARPALPAPAQAEIDQMLSSLPGLRPSLERLDPLDQSANDARRLMGTHLPGLIDRYLAVPPAYRMGGGEDEPSVDDRLVEALRAGRGALDELGERMARTEVSAFETQGRFIESRYRDDPVDR